MNSLERFLLTLPFFLAIVFCTVVAIKVASAPEQTDMIQTNPLVYVSSPVESGRIQVTVPYHDDVTLTSSGVRYCDAVPLTVGEQLHAQEMCKKYDVPYPLLLGLIETESSFQDDADSGWAYGYCQIGYINEEWLANEHIDIYKPYDNIEAGCLILGDLLKEYDTDRALMAYNMGEAGAEELWLEGFLESEYSKSVRDAADRWEERLR